MRLWVLGEVVCSGKRTETRKCESRFATKIQLEMSHSAIASVDGQFATVSAVEGVQPAGWKMVKKEYFAIPHYFCPDCEAYCKDFESRPT